MARKSFSLLDDLLPEVTTDTLRALLELPAEQRPTEGPLYEFKGEWTPQHVAKTVAALANTYGGIVLFGAKAAQGVLTGFPGLESGPEWPREFANNVVGHVSPLPAWEPFVVAAPDVEGREVLVVKVPRSLRTPHIVIRTGLIYQRSPGGTSDPIRDRATLDVLVKRGDDNERLVRARAARFLDRLPRRHAPDYDRVRKFQFAVVSIPVPYGAFDQPALLTRSSFRSAETFFTPNRDLGEYPTRHMIEDGIRLQFDDRYVTLYTDGTLGLFFKVDGNDAIARLPVLDGLLQDVLDAQRRLPRPVREAHVFVEFGAALADLTTAMPGARGVTVDAPWEWDWDVETSTQEDAVTEVRHEFQRRILRAAGREVFDPE